MTIYRAVYRIMKKNGTAGSSPAKSEWVHYERKYSNAMWHWHVMKDERFEGLNLIDDASSGRHYLSMQPQRTPFYY